MFHGQELPHLQRFIVTRDGAMTSFTIISLQ
jgi:hypothetical protein